MRSAVGLSRSWLAVLLAATALHVVAHAQSAPAPGTWTEREPPRGWVIVRTADFEVQAEISEARARRLAQFLQGLRPQFEALWPGERRLGPQVVKVFHNADEREKWAHAHGLELERRPPGSPPSCARLDPFLGDILAFDSGRLLEVASGVDPVRLGSDRVISLLHADVQRVYPLLDAAAAHYAPDLARDTAREAFRQYRAAAGPDKPLPLWLEEGVGDWLAAATPDQKPWNRSVPGDADVRRSRPGPVHQDRLRDALRALGEGIVLPAGDVLARSAINRETEPPGLLAQGWALVHLLMTSSDEAQAAAIPALLTAYRRSDDGWVTLDEVLPEIDTAALDRTWRAWLLEQKPDDPLAELALQFGKVVRTSDLVAPDWIKECYAWHRRHVPPPAPVPP